MTRGGFFPVDSLAGVYVLVVDASPDGRRSLMSILRYGGALVDAVDSPAAALGALRLVKPDALVVDLALPAPGAAHLMRAVRALKPEDGGMVPAIAIGTLESHREVARASGFDAAVLQPLDPWELCRIVADHALRH